MTIDPDDFREVMAALPGGVTLVTALDADGTPRGLTCTAVCSVSAEPPLLLACLDRGSRTLAAIREAGAFAVNVLGAEGLDLARRFSEPSDDKFEGVAWSPGGSAGGAPLIGAGAALGHAECTVQGLIEAGDHWIVIGLIEAGGTAGRGPALLYHRRRYVPGPGPGGTGTPEEGPLPAGAPGA
ncbi:MAG: flavin reductase family protein [Actinobacteria bacterium]|nr:flavin reductase family protein [Actinomycetota bacterium]